MKSSAALPTKDLVVWCRQPGDPKVRLDRPPQNEQERRRQAQELNKAPEGLLLGNGRLGAMVFGRPTEEVVVLNESSLWSGWPEPDDARPGAYEALQKARELIRGGDIAAATKAIREEFFSLGGYGKPDFGAYQSFCNLRLMPVHGSEVSDYRRELDLRTAVATVSYVCGGVRFTRETFCSYPDQVWVMRLSADKPGQQSFDLALESAHKLVRVAAKDHELVLSGEVDLGPEGKARQKQGMRFESRLVVRAEGGAVSVSKPDGLSVRNADTVVLILAGATNYELKYPIYRGGEPSQRNEAVLGAVRDRSYGELRRRHVTDHGRLFGRVDLRLGSAGRRDLPIDERLEAYGKSRDDRWLEALVFQYGRYLLIASSRTGGLPANLQGIWNRSNSPPWFCDYHLNINLQMNYWPTEVCNLSDCSEPLARWVEDLVEPGRRTAERYYHCGGWVAHHVASVWGHTSPGPNRGIHMFEPESAAWICQNLWEHFTFTQDREYLKRTAWPILKGAAEFWLENLQEVENGRLAASPSWSPEQGPLSDGAFYSTEVVYDLFSNCLEAARILGVEPQFAKKLEAARGRLVPLAVGEYGQLQEWRDPKLEKNANKNSHRHLSHLVCAFPGRQVLVGRDDRLVEAVRKSLEYRRDSRGMGWTYPWKAALWARLQDGNRALAQIGDHLSTGMSDHLWNQVAGVYQIDGNLGYSAAVAEMLVQSHEQAGVGNECVHAIRLLPALPDAWKTGSVKGLRARGGFEVEMAWKEGKLSAATLYSIAGTRCLVRYGDRAMEMKFQPGESKPVK